MKRLGRCHVLIVLLIILTIGIDESEEVSFVVEDRDGNSSLTATVDVDVSTDCDKVFLIVVTGTGPFNNVIATGNTGGAFTTAVDPDEKLQCNMATIKTNAITSYNLSITITDFGDSTATTKNVTVTVKNLVIPNIGTPCTVTSDCNTTTVAGTVCDTIMSPPVCKLALGAFCTASTDCVSGAVCGTGYTADICLCLEDEISSR
ncbi:uncharacterized protein LOC128236475 [Mya arenaria]|uniref:uncharacterized protein LOC128236475 n=1 Tax=Mya arenaria TaxID=6604 RepID=UPI0022E8E896|nr:uncharacterized protein LOC128236475 [Mya arenaria]